MPASWIPPGWSPAGWKPAGWPPGGAGLPVDLAAAVAAILDRDLVRAAAPAANWAGTGLAPKNIGTPPRKLLLPYVQVDDPDEDSAQVDTGGTFNASGTLQVRAYAADRGAAKALGALAQRRILAGPVRFAGGHLMVLRPAGRMSEKDPDAAPGGGDCWMERRLFEFKFSYQP